jgi:hypothetical protein
VLPVLFDVQRVFADEVFGAVVDARDWQVRSATGAGRGVNLADAVDAFVSLDFDVVEAVCGEDFDCGDFHCFLPFVAGAGVRIERFSGCRDEVARNPTPV